jgi:2-oxoglutarate ferredoxin oxidoreductase subunit alpha
LTQAYFHSHGDINFIILLPGSVAECFEFGWRAMDFAERFQTPVMVLSDLDLGMNQWMSPKFVYPDRPIDRGKILWEEDLEKLLQERNGDWGRYLDIDGDGIPYRTVVGNKHHRGAYFTRGTGHDPYGRYSEEPDVWENLLNRLARKVGGAKSVVPAPVVKVMEGAKIGIIAMGSTDPAVIEARDQMIQQGLPTDYLRVRAIPFSDEVTDFIKNHERTYVVEVNRDGQLKQLLSLEAPEYAGKLRKASHLDGLALSAKWIRETIFAQEATE